MALPADNRDLTRLLRQLRQEVAQNRTDIQRLWRLTAREVHEPFFVIGGDVEDSSSSGSEASGPPYPPPDNDDPPGGGPGDGLDDDCCLWIWDGEQWTKAADNTSGCECPRPEGDGTVLFEQQVTCCEESSSASSSGEACAVSCWECMLPCVITHTMGVRVGQTPAAACEDFSGSRECVWNDETNVWESGCFGLANNGAYQSGRIVITVKTPATTACVLVVTHLLYLSDDCSGASAVTSAIEVEITSCDPMFGESESACSGAYSIALTS